MHTCVCVCKWDKANSCFQCYCGSNFSCILLYEVYNLLVQLQEKNHGDFTGIYKQTWKELTCLCDLLLFMLWCLFLLGKVSSGVCLHIFKFLQFLSLFCWWLWYMESLLPWCLLIIYYFYIGRLSVLGFYFYNTISVNTYSGWFLDISRSRL